MQGGLECQCIAREVVYKFSSYFINNIKCKRWVPKLIGSVGKLVKRGRTIASVGLLAREFIKGTDRP